jgi:hypothetical protein
MFLLYFFFYVKTNQPSIGNVPTFQVVDINAQRTNYLVHYEDNKI